MRFVHTRKMEEAVPVLRCGGGYEDGERGSGKCENGERGGREQKSTGKRSGKWEEREIGDRESKDRDNEDKGKGSKDRECCVRDYEDKEHCSIGCEVSGRVCRKYEDREVLREAINRLGYSLTESCQFDVDAFAERQFGGSAENAAGFFTEALLQGAYRFGRKALTPGVSEKLFERRGSLATEPDVTVYLISDREIETEMEKAQCLARCRNYARMLGDLPANYLTAEDFCRYAEQLVREKPALSLEIFRNQELTQMGAGGILAVNQASRTPAALLHLRYQGSQEGPVTALVGKGVMFDSGGMHLKSMEDMEGMKYDMCGAADVLCLLEYAAETAYAFPLEGVIPLAENAVGEGCARMGDVISTLSGRTVELYNTDAEGRMLLADALTFAAGKANRLVDIATLTCSCREALGDETVGFLCNEESLAGDAAQAAKESGEPVWRLPLGERYRRALFWSKTADLANYMPDKKAGASVAGCFLEEFTEGLPWVHFDMVGPAVLRKENGRLECGATGTIFSTVAKLLETQPTVDFPNTASIEHNR